MAKKPAGKSNFDQIHKQGGARRAGVQNFGDLVAAGNHVRLDEYDGETIYISKVEPIKSDTYGEGFKITFRDLPNAKEVYTASSFGQGPVAQLAELYRMTNEGKRLSSDSPIKTKVIKAGRTYRFE